MEENSFEKVKQKLVDAEKLADRHFEAAESAIKALASLDNNLAAEGEKRTRELAQSRDELTRELKNPTIRIAAIGTTSSAKSSLLNFLCGAELLPTDVQEKSAGVTRVRDAEKPGLFIESTAEAVWETGKIEVDSPEAIRARLEEVMDAYRKQSRDNPDIEAPEFVVEYPIEARVLLDAPKDFGLELLDLPGLKYTGDERNRRVMAECRDSLCLVTFGAHETDPLKQEALLDAAMEQIELIDAPLERMFFVATKIDEFLLKTPDGWPRNERNYLAERLDAIKERVGERYGKDKADAINLSRISPLPALLSLKLFDEGEARKAWKRIDAGFRGLITQGRGGDPYDGVDLDLMGKFAEWSEAEKREVFNQLCETTGSVAFLDALKGRLAGNLPAILLPPPYAKYAEGAEETGEWLKRGIDAARLHIRGDAERYVVELEKMAKEQEAIQKTAAAALESFARDWLTLVIRSAFYGDNDKEGWALLWKRFPNFNSPLLLDSENWGINIEKAFLKPIACSRDAILGGKPLPDSLPERKKLEAALRDLIKHGYTRRVCIEGMDGVANDAAMKSLPIVFDNFTRLCEEIADRNYKLATEVMLDRILACLDQIQSDFIKYLNELNEKLPRELRGAARITAKGLREFTEYQLAPASVIRSRTRKWEKFVNVSREVSNLTGNFITNIWRRITGNATRIIQERKVEVIVKLPSIKTIEVDFMSAFRELIPERLGVIETAIMEKVDEFSQNITAYRTSLYDAFRANLERLSNEKMENAREAERKLDQAAEKRESAEADLREIRNSYSSEGM